MWRHVMQWFKLRTCQTYYTGLQIANGNVGQRLLSQVHPFHWSSNEVIFRCFSVHSGFEAKETVTLSWTLFFTFGASFCFRSVECLRNEKLWSLSAAFSALQLFVVVIHLYFRYVFLFLKFSKKKLARLMKRFSSLARKPRWSATGLNWIGVAEFFCFKERISSLSSIA